MRGERNVWLVRLAMAGAVLAAIVGAAVLLNESAAGASGPQPIAWDKEACTECHMHISAARYAAQLITDTGEARSFDDPGCMLSYLAREKTAVQTLYFHHEKADRWLSAPQVAFVTLPGSPMGYDLGAVDVGTAGALTLADAKARVAARVAQAQAGGMR